jgi:hypothetical protein
LAGVAALDGTGVTAVARDDATVSLRLLGDRREELGALRTQAVCTGWAQSSLRAGCAAS